MGRSVTSRFFFTGYRYISKLFLERFSFCNRKVEIVNVYKFFSRDSYFFVDDTISFIIEKDVIRYI